MAQTLSDLDDLTAAWLTETLEREGHLPEGEVSSVEVTSTKPLITSTIAFLDVSYSVETDLPEKLFMKFANPDSKLDEFALAAARKEETYYRTIHPQCRPSPSRDVLDVQVDEASESFHLLMDDVSATHYQNTDPLPMTAASNKRLFEVLAAFHAQWWDHPDLVDIFGEEIRQDTVVYGLDTVAVSNRLGPFADKLGEFLTRDRRRLYERILESIPEQRDLSGRLRLTEANHVTLIHEDAHNGNVFFPRDLDAEDPFLIDWQSWRVHTGTNDLAYLPVLGWYPARRAVVEQLLLDHYHGKLLEGGVREYTREDCWHDYRLSSLRMMLKVPLFHSIGLSDGLCYQMVERSFLNFEDLELEELI